MKEKRLAQVLQPEISTSEIVKLLKEAIEVHPDLKDFLGTDNKFNPYKALNVSPALRI